MNSAPPQNTGMGTAKTTPEFIAEAVARYGDKYDYSNVLYKRSDIEVEIICPKHGPFLKTGFFFCVDTHVNAVDMTLPHLNVRNPERRKKNS